MDKLLLGVLAAAVGRHVAHGALQDLQQRLLHTLAARAAGFGGEIPTGGYRCEYPVDRQDSICPYGFVWGYDRGILGIAG